MAEYIAKEPLDVTVYETLDGVRVPALTATASVRQLESYMRRSGWEQAPAHVPGRMWWRAPNTTMNLMLLTKPAFNRPVLMAMAVCGLAEVEGRPPADVLADVAKEPAR